MSPLLDAIRVEHLPDGFDRWQDLLGLIRRSFAYMDGVIDPPSSANGLTLENLKAKAETETCFVAWRGGELAGCIFAAERSDHFYVGKFAVASNMQGFGIGRALMQAAEDLARALGKPVLELQARIELTGNHASFARLGFRETERTAHAGYDRPTSLTMRKVLA